jgi:Carboxypeptidase regulatory-like domain
MGWNRIVRYAFVFSVILLWTGLAWGQATTSLRGTVTDPSGAAVPNATVHLINAGTNVERTTSTDAQGEYVFPEVLPGSYNLQVEAGGFATYRAGGIQLLVHLPATANVTMKIGAAQQTVTVTEQAPVINRTDATLGQTMGTVEVENLPLPAENMPLLLSLQPGVVYNGENILQDNYDTRAGSVNGERSDQNNLTLDGVSVNDEFNGYAFNGVLPTTPFSTEEFRVTTSNYGATEGRSSGAQIAMVTKGGTNKFHGSLYEFNRNTLGEANDWFIKQSQAESGLPNRPEHLVRNVFGGTLGGPILKDRFFFFFNYEGNRTSTQASADRIIPSATLRDGIIQYACADTTQCAGGSVTGASGQTYTVQPGYNALSPTQLAQMDPLGVGPSTVALSYFNGYPIPNSSCCFGDGFNYGDYRFAAPTRESDNWYIARLDYKLTRSGNQTLFWRGTGVDDRYFDSQFLPNTGPLDTTLELSKGFVAGYTAVLSPHWVNNLRYGLTHQSYGYIGDTTQPWVQMRGLDQGITYPFGFTAPVHNLVDTVNWQKGTHNFQFGGNLLFIRRNSTSQTNSFSDALTNADYVVSGGLANTNDEFNPACIAQAYTNCSAADVFPAVASDFNHSYDFPLAAMIGMASEVDTRYNYKITSQTAATPLAQGAAVTRHWATDSYDFFFQDTWQARPNLSVTYGLNYQLMTPITETTGQEVTPSVNMGTWFNERAAAMLKGIPDNQVMGGTPISFAPAGSFFGKPGLYGAQTKNFAPRVGLAWSPQSSWGWLGSILGQDKTVIRAGFGMYYDNFGPALSQSYDASGSFGVSTYLPSEASFETVGSAPRITDINTIPTTDNNGVAMVQPAPPSNFPVTYTGVEAIARGIDQSLKTPYSYAADLSIERELPGHMTLDVAYVGHFAHRLLVLDDIATPLNLVDPNSGIDYFAAATRLSQLWRANTPESSINASTIGPTAQYWQDMIQSQSSYTLACAGGTTSDVLVAMYDVFGPGCGNLYNETSALYKIDRHGIPAAPATGPQSFYNPQYSSLWDWRSMAYSNYNALEIGLHRQMSQGLLFGFNYTYSKSLDIESQAERGAHFLTDSVINPWDPSQMYGPSDYDLRHQINAYWVAQLPFGRGKRFGGGVNGWADALIGGWQLSGTTRWTSGFPFSVFMGYVWPTNWDEMGWANVTGKPIPMSTTLIPGTNGFASPNVFSDPTEASAGFDYAFPGESGVRNNIRGQGYFGWDMNLEKSWKIPRFESQSIQARWSVFNVANTTRFDVRSVQDEWDAGNFGTYSTTLTNPRVMELSLIYQF